MASALEEVQACLQPDKIDRIAVDAPRRVLGWIGGNSQYAD